MSKIGNNDLDIQMVMDLASVSQRLISIDNHIKDFKMNNVMFSSKLDEIRKEMYELKGYVEGRISDIREEKTKELSQITTRLSFIMGGISTVSVLITWYLNYKM